MRESARRTRRVADKIRLFLMPPGWLPAELGGFVPPPEVDRPRYRKFDTPLTRRRAVYVLLHFAAVIAVTLALLYAEGRLALPVLLGGAGFVLLSLVTLSALVEGRPWGPALEAARLVAAVVAAATFSWR